MKNINKKLIYNICLGLFIFGTILIISGVLIRNISYLYGGMIVLGIIIFIACILIIIYTKNYEKIKKTEFTKYKDKVKKLKFSVLDYYVLKEDIVNYLKMNDYSYASEKIYKKRDYDEEKRSVNYYHLVYLLETIKEAEKEEETMIKEGYYNTCFVFIDEFDIFNKEDLLIKMKEKMINGYDNKLSESKYLSLIVIDKYKKKVYYIKDPNLSDSYISMKKGLKIIKKVRRKENGN